MEVALTRRVERHWAAAAKYRKASSVVVDVEKRTQMMNEVIMQVLLSIATERARHPQYLSDPIVVDELHRWNTVDS